MLVCFPGTPVTHHKMNITSLNSLKPRPHSMSRPIISMKSTHLISSLSASVKV